MIKPNNVWGVYVLEDTDDDVSFYCIALFYNEESAKSLKNNLIQGIEDVIDDLEDNNEDYFTEEHCNDENVKEYLNNANLKEGIQVRSCTYKIYVSQEAIYK